MASTLQRSRRWWLRRRTLAVLFIAAGLLAAACSSSGDTEPQDDTAPQDAAAALATVPPPVSAPQQAAPSSDAPAADVAAPALVAAGPYLTFNENIIDGFSSDGIDLNDADSVFSYVFDRLPSDVTVYPSENYYYFILKVEGRQIWGNIRLPAGSRENGVLSFGYFEFVEFPTTSERPLSGSKFYSDADGVIVSELDRFTYEVRFRGKSVAFHFKELDQAVPSVLALGADERFIQRTFDESGYQFYLLFNETDNYFFWVLNEEDVLPDVLEPLGDQLLVGRRSGFAFWEDAAHGDRKVLAGVRQLNIRRNDYFDGPFDQLADNYADETRVSEYMQRAFPSIEGRIDKYGYYTDTERPLRVALSTYLTYASNADLLRFMALLDAQDDPYRFISTGGRSATADQSATSSAAGSSGAGGN